MLKTSPLHERLAGRRRWKLRRPRHPRIPPFPPLSLVFAKKDSWCPSPHGCVNPISDVNSLPRLLLRTPRAASRRPTLAAGPESDELPLPTSWKKGATFYVKNASSARAPRGSSPVEAPAAPVSTHPTIPTLISRMCKEGCAYASMAAWAFCSCIGRNMFYVLQLGSAWIFFILFWLC